MSASDNAAFLRGELVRHLLAERPRSVLDVGCGGGAVLELLAEAGVPAVGVEFDARRLAAAREGSAMGFDAVQASAVRLPFADRAFDWGVLRHVAHHLDDGRAAVRELGRVARTGLVLAEPWRDPARPLQEVGQRLDDWTRRQDRRLGRVHAADVAPQQLVDWARPAFGRVRVLTCLRPALHALEEVYADIDARRTGLDASHRDQREAARLLQEIERVGVELSGSAIVVLRRRRSV